MENYDTVSEIKFQMLAQWCPSHSYITALHAVVIESECSQHFTASSHAFSYTV